jgi:hypothetical protein
MDKLKGKYVDMTQLIHQVIPTICISFHFPKVIEARALFLLLIRFSVVFYLCYFLEKKIFWSAMATAMAGCIISLRRISISFVIYSLDYILWTIRLLRSDVLAHIYHYDLDPYAFLISFSRAMTGCIRVIQIPGPANTAYAHCF